ncbi:MULTISPECIES: aldehyde ferredoxin oxidoreductase family protein [Aminobacterium]|uniref:aldehyde ferredoxin oxidoreductase family protein n=1 Tax=Aminobacterium TaxID=81466 RepID=UPI00257C8549|nr:aldehyde ferredoxin oxidoreductase family protein [Aminobacterium sp. UBA4834]
MGSRMGTILRIDLSSHKISKEPVDEKLLRAYIGGRGYGSRILFNENPPNIDPLSPENRLLFVTGPLTGRGVPAAGRYMVVTKSPLTGYIASSNSGGYWGAELAKAGWFMIVVEGKANHPVYIHIYDQNVEIRDSSHLWGLNTHETTDRILEEIKDTKARVLCIGPAGEILSPLASIMNEKNRAAGRSGVGAVMGSKNLKAIAVRGTSRPYVAQSEELSAVLKERLEKLKKHPVTSQGLPAYGTAILVNIINQTGAYPHRNWQGSYMEDADKQSGETLAEKYLTANYHCFGCPIGCGRITKVKGKAGEGPEYETIFAFGACCGIASIEPIIRASYICNEYGLDTIGTGVTIAAAMELYEKKFIKKEELEGGPELLFGNEEAITYWTEKMGKGEGLGKKLNQGSWRLCTMYGHPELSMTVKKQEMPAYDARGIQGIGLTYAVSNRGACHVRGYLISPEILGAPEKLDPDDISQKPMWGKIFHDLTAAIDSSGMCLFTSFALDAADYAAFLKAGTGFDYTADEIMTCGERIWNLERLFNLREGLNPGKEDTLPPRLLKEPIPEGPGKGKLSRVPEMLPEYYRLRGWDEKGIPTEETRRRLNLL